MHSYPGPDCPASETHRAAVLGEFGGYGLTVPEHSWSTHGWGYMMLPDEKELAARYLQTFKYVWRMHALRGLSAVVYTQNTDVETECDGLQTYDRAVAKMDPAAVSAANHCGFSAKPVKIILADGLSGHVNWKFTLVQPGDGWFKPGFDLSAWKEGAGGFGTAGTPGVTLNTRWDTGDIWLRREFTLKPEEVSGIRLQVFHDEDVEVYLNGVLALNLPGFVIDYDEFEISKEAARALQPGRNIIAVHCHQTTGGQGVDVGILTLAAGKEPGQK
jgi:hypothetical protein